VRIERRADPGGGRIEADIALATHRFVHQHPELAHEERECSRYLADLLEDAGFEVERGIADMPTAFRAKLTGAAPGRSVGLIALYDAVPVFRPDGSIEPVHSCGHDAIPAGVVATALALADLREELPGSLDRPRPRPRVGAAPQAVGVTVGPPRAR
jgi:metal-dependent amidase/aminoacylase/carboxypeptidase family protein